MKNLKRFLTVLTLLIPALVFAQKEGNNWYFGNKAGISFNSGSPVALTNGQLNTNEGCATISNSKGRLLFYTDGISVWDSTHNKTPNGTGLLGHSSATQSGVIVPCPDTVGHYFIFTVDYIYGTEGLCYSEFKMSLNSGKGDIVASKKNIRLIKSSCEKITAIKHANGRDYWVLAHHYGTDTLYSFLITPAGLSSSVVKNRTGFKISVNTDQSIGYLKVSPNGTKVAYANYKYDTLAIGDFNTSTGVVSNVWTTYIDNCYGLEFSSSGSFLYVSEASRYRIYQFNTQAKSRSTFISSKVKIDSVPGLSINGALQLGPDGKIYMSRGGNSYLDVIHAPDSSGKACRFQKNYVYLGGKSAVYGLPTFIQSFFRKNEAQYIRNCVNDSTFVWPLVTADLDSVKWDFGDTASGSANISKSLKNAYHIYKKIGFYKVKLYSYFKTNKDTTIINIPIKNPKPFLGNDTVYCNTFFGKLSPTKDYIKYKWSNGDSLKSITINTKGTIILTATDSVKCIASDTIVIKNSIITAQLSIDSIICKRTNITFENKTTLEDDNLKSVLWKLSDSTSYTDTIFNKSFNTADSFKVKLIVTSENGCKDSIAKKVIVHPNTSIGFSINKTPQCFNGHDFVLTNSSTLSRGTFSNRWRFGDGDTAITKDISSKKYKVDSSYQVSLITTTDKGCKDTISKTLVVNTNPKSAYSINQITQCFTFNSYDFTNSSAIRTGSITSNTWDFGDSKSATSNDVKAKKYSSADSFVVMLLNISDKGCRDSISKKVYVNPNANLGFSINKTPQCFNGHDFVFTNSSTVSKGIITYDWSFGDGTFATSKDIASKKYSIDSTYKVDLITTTDKGCKDTLTKNVVLNPNPKAGFGMNQSTQCFKWNAFDYTNSSTIRTGNIATYAWVLGDTGTRSTKDIKAKHYSTEDSFKVDLLTISNNGCRDSLSKWVYLLNSPQPDFTINNDTQCFNGHGFSYQNNSTIAAGNFSSLWHLGDATTNSNKDVSTKQYSTYGNYKVLLILTSNNNCKDSLEKTIRINPNAVNKFNIDKDRQCYRGHNFNFTNQSTNPEGTLTYNWKMDDGITFTSKDVLNHKYATEDTFNVRLITTSDKGCLDTLTKMVVTYAQPVANFILPQDSQCWQKHYFIIINNTTLKYGTLSHVWDFGDGTKDFTQTPQTKRYANKSADYVLKYKVTSDHGCTDSAQKKVSLLERPIAEFTINDSIQCFKTNFYSYVNKTAFSDLSTITYFWDYGDGSKTTGKVPKSLSYPTANYYNVQLIAHSYLNNCVDTLDKIFVVAPHATPDYTIDNDSQCLRTNTFTFSNLSKVKFGTMTYNWKFGDNTKDSATHPIKKYTGGSNYSVKILATTNHNCKDSISKPIVIIPHPKAKFTVADSTFCKVQSLNITNNTTVLYGTFTQVWRFDEGADQTRFNVSGKKLVAPGFHPVRLAVISNFGCTDTITKQVFVEKSGTTKISIIENDSQCLRGNKTQFNVFSQGGIINLSGFTWQFGDGNSSNVQKPTHTYTVDSSFKISAETVSSNGCLDTAYFAVVIHPHPVSDFSNTTPCFPNKVDFTNISTIKKGSITSQTWDLGNMGITSPLVNPSIQYPASGTYTVKLKNYSNYGCTDSVIKSLAVMPKPTAMFSYTQVPSPDEIRLQMNNESSLDATTYNWDLDEGNFSQDINPLAIYKDSGRFTIILEVMNDAGCRDTFSVKTGLFYPEFVIYLPNVFSPNGNGINEIFKPGGSQYNRDYTLEIFNRWGERVFLSYDVTHGWDGTYKGEDCQDGIYYCYLRVMPMKGPLKSYYTYLRLLR